MSWKIARDIRHTCVVKRVDTRDIQRRSRSHAEDCAGFPTFDEASEPAGTAAAKKFSGAERQFKRAVASEVVRTVARLERVVQVSISNIAERSKPAGPIGIDSESSAPCVRDLILNAVRWPQRPLRLQ